MINKRMLNLFAIIVILISVEQLCAQTDSISATESVEIVKDYNYQRKYEYLNKNLIEETTLFKIGAKYMLFMGDTTTVNYWYPALAISYERKFSSSFSALFEISEFIGIDSISNIALTVQTKYYFLKNKEIRNKTGANNFFGPYALFGVQDIFAYQYNDTRKKNKRANGFKSLPVIQLGIGQQMGIGSRMYVDFSMYGIYNTSADKFGFQLEGKINFILGKSKRKLK